MAETRANCPQCGGYISVAENSPGVSMSCPHCAARITVTRVTRTRGGRRNGIKWEYHGALTVATTLDSRPPGGPDDGQGTPPVSQTPEKNALTASAAFRGKLPSNKPKPKTYEFQGCLPVFLICTGAFMGLCHTGFSDNTTWPTGSLLVLVGIVWEIVARRISIWRQRR